MAHFSPVPMCATYEIKGAKMGQVILAIVGLLIVTLGVVCIFDARVLTKKMFSFGDQNDASLGLKLFGFLFAIVGAFIVYLCVHVA